MFVLVPSSGKIFRSINAPKCTGRKEFSRRGQGPGFLWQVRAQSEGETTRGSLERAFERDAVSVAVELSAWAERPGVYHPEVSSRARWATEQQHDVATAAHVAAPETDATTTAASTAQRGRVDGSIGTPRTATTSGLSETPVAQPSSPGEGARRVDYDPCAYTRDTSVSSAGAPLTPSAETACPVYYRRKRDHLSAFSSPLSGYMDRCIWCEGAGARSCPWCHGAGCRYKAVFPTYAEMNELIERARAGDVEARERLQNPSTACRPCPVCEGKGMLPCRRCHGTGTNHL
jgi:hypothetical protein